MKFPLKVEIRETGESKQGQISIAAVNHIVKKGKVPNYITVRILDPYDHRFIDEAGVPVPHSDSVGLEYLYHPIQRKSIAEDLRAELRRRIAVKEDSTLDLGYKSLKPIICLRVALQVQTKSGLPTEDPGAEPKFRVRLKYWDGNNHHLWADYDPVTDDLVVKIKKKKTKLVFTNHADVLAAIRELMPS